MKHSSLLSSLERLSLERLSRLALCAVALASLSAGCDELPQEPSVSDGYHVFGVRAEPPIARPDDKVTLTLYDLHPRLDNFVYSWSACLYSYGAATGFECVSKEFQEAFFNEDSPRITIDLGPDGLDLRNRIKTFEELLDVDGQAPSLERGHDIYITISSGLPGNLTRTVKRLHVRENAPRAHNPTITGWELSTDELGSSPCVRSTTGAFTLAELESSEELQGLSEAQRDAYLSSFIDPDGELLERGRAYLAREIIALGERCVVRAEAEVKVKLNVELGSEGEGPHLFGWLADEAPYAAPSTYVEGAPQGAASVGRYLMPNRSGSLELYFTVRDEAGGFSIAHQPLTLVPNKSTVN